MKGKGVNTVTSGLEGQWTTNPLRWDNEYFTQLLDHNYTLITGSGGAPQWINNVNGYMMLTTDLALLEDDDYLDIVTEFAEDIDVLNTAFGQVWEKLTTNGGVWSVNKHCLSAEELNDDNTNDNNEDSSIGYIIGAIIAVLVVLALIVLIFYIYRKKNNEKNQPDENSKKEMISSNKTANIVEINDDDDGDNADKQNLVEDVGGTL